MGFIGGGVDGINELVIKSLIYEYIEKGEEGGLKEYIIYHGYFEKSIESSEAKKDLYAAIIRIDQEVKAEIEAGDCK